MTPLAARALEMAAEADGVKEDPPGSNRGPEVDRYQRTVGLDPAIHGGKPWCAAFVSTMIMDAYHDLTIPARKFRGSASCQRLLDLNQGLLIDEPEVGCVFVHISPDGTGHCGFVTALEDKALITREGNSDKHGSRTGGSVVEGRRGYDFATGYIRIQ